MLLNNDQQPSEPTPEQLVEQIGWLKAELADKERQLQLLAERRGQLKPVSATAGAFSGTFAASHQHELLQRIFDNIPVMLVLWDPHLNRFTLNRHAEAVLGWTTEDANEGDFMSSVYPDENYRAEVSAYMRALKPGWQEWTVTAQSGERIPTEWTNVRLTNETLIGFGVDLRESKASERALRDSRKTVQRHLEEIEWIYGNAPVGLCVLDEKLRYLRINDRLAEINGFSVEKHLGQTVREMVPDLADAVEPEMGKVFETGEPVLGIEIDGETAAQPGVLRTWLESWLPIKRSDGSIVGLNVVAQEITEQKRAEAALRASEERWAVTLASIGDAVIATDAKARITFMNPVAEHLTGWRASDAAGRPIEAVFRIVNEETRTAVEISVDKVLARGRVVDLTEHTVLLPKTGAAIPIADSAAPIRDGDGHLLGAVLVFRDISGPRQAEKKLRESEKRLRDVMDNMVAMIGLLTPDGILVEANRTALRAANLEPGDVIGKPFEECYWWAWSTEVQQKLRAAIARAALGEESRYDEMIRVGKDQYMTISFMLAPMYDSDGRIRYLVPSATDISDRKHAEKALRQLNETLEQKVAERTQLAESRARHLQSLAVELIEAEERERQRLAHLLHDDLQQILASARLQLQCADDSLMSNPNIQNVENAIGEAIQKARNLSHDLSPPVLHHAELVDALKWLVQQMGDKFGLMVDLEGDGSCRVTSHQMKVFLFRAAQELLFNVVKHAEVNRAKVTLTEDNGLLTMTVADNGRGFDPNVLKGSSAKMGFGLMSLRERVQFVGGTFTVNGAPGRGSRFTLMLSQDATAGEPRRRSSDLKPMATYPGASESVQGARLLFVDDHALMRQGLIKLFAHQPDIHVVGEAADGVEAVEMVRKLKPDVVLMDVSMPKMDGIETTRVITAEFPEVRVVGLTMYEENQIVQAMRQAGAAAVLSKTGSAANLLKTIYDIIHLKDPEESLHRSRITQTNDR